ncbi:SET domain-containing protein [Cubamyces sp. BRFM 1775]|nr:SET domain-containing protein [Cubamyces sp. BRFM 1775]
MEDTCTIVHIPGKGEGLIATRAIARGELIFAEAPLLVQRRNISSRSIANALARLPREGQMRFLSLANSWKGRQHPLVGLWLTNAIPCGTPDDPYGDKTEVEGVFPAIARLNASCCPNLYHWWDAVTQRLYFRAARDIAIGEELCMTYMDALLPRRERLIIMRQHYNYECQCSACKLTEQDGHDSDYRRSTVAEIRSQLLKYNDPSYGLHKMRLALRLLDEEGLLEVYGNPFYANGFEFCALAGDAESASAWASKAWEFECVTKGPDSETAQEWEERMRYPTRSHIFGSGPRRYRLQGPDV